MPANDHLTRGGVSVSAATAGAAAITASNAASARTVCLELFAAVMILVPLRRDASAARFGRHGGAGRRTGQVRLGDRGGQPPRRLDQPKERQDDQEMDEVPRGEDAGGNHVTTFGRLRSEPAEPDADHGEDPEELPIER